MQAETVDMLHIFWLTLVNAAVIMAGTTYNTDNSEISFLTIFLKATFFILKYAGDCNNTLPVMF